jgi:hypothetical protein
VGLARELEGQVEAIPGYGRPATCQLHSTHVTLSGHAQRLAPVEVEVALAVALAREPVVEAGGEIRVVPEVGVALALDAGGVLGEPGVEGGRGRLSVGAAKVVEVAELGGEGAAAARRLGVVLFEGGVEGGNVVAGEEGLVARPEVVLLSEGWRRRALTGTGGRTSRMRVAASSAMVGSECL